MNGRIILENSPGSSTRELGRHRREKRKIIGVVAIASLGLVLAAYLCFLFSGHRPALEDAILFLVYLLFLSVVNRAAISGMEWVWHREKQAANGAVAKGKIGALLNRLPADCVVLQDLNTGRGNIDHLILRQDGAIFLIETKSHRGEITEQDGELRHNGLPLEKNFLRQTHDNVYWLQTFLKARLGSKVWIHAAIVFPNAQVTVRSKVRGVPVISANHLGRWMSHSSGNPYIAALLHPHIERLRTELIEQSERNDLR